MRVGRAIENWVRLISGSTVVHGRDKATFSDAPNKIVTENQNTGTPQSVWAIHGSIANQGDSQIEGFATQISTNAAPRCSLPRG